MATPDRDPYAAELRRERRALNDYSAVLLLIERAIRSNRLAGYSDAETLLEQARLVLMPPEFRA